jgi:putative endonuclease
MAWLYILQSEKSGRFYIGSTTDVDRRLIEHNAGQTTSTRNRGPWKVVHREHYADAKAASARELEIKSWKSHRSIQELIDKIR